VLTVPITVALWVARAAKDQVIAAMSTTPVHSLAAKRALSLESGPNGSTPLRAPAAGLSEESCEDTGASARSISP
jgi:hypothetical protein